MQDYYFDACGAVTGVTCSGSSVQGGANCIQTYGSPAPQPPTFPADSCAALGAFSSQACKQMTPTKVTCQYTGGDGDRTSEVVYTCGPDYLPPNATQPNPSAVPAHYVINFVGPSACLGAGAGGMGWGDFVCLFLPIFSFLYFAIGYAYNYKYKELKGIDAVPQLEYWRQLPGLVKDGCNYSWEQLNVFIAHVKERQRGAPADAGLKAALAENEDGAASSTAYEERQG